jgi:predicted glutamine amidotransferase
MCRWLAYAGRSLLLEELLFKPENSLIRQSMAASKSIVPTNGDGFGLGWYGTQSHPGIFRDTLPAWNDANLHSLSEQIQSELFFAHVRASTGTSTSRENCHPFRHGNLLFMQNGQIGGYASVRRELEQKIPAELYCERRGSTDSEAFFLLACGNGLDGNVRDALQRTVAQVRELMDNEGVDEPFRLTAAIADGKRIHALRYSSDNQSPTLFYASGGAIRVDDGQVEFTEGNNAVLVLSEPLDGRVDGWTEVPDGHILEACGGGGVKIRSFQP